MGDFYIDTAAHALYGPKDSGGWGSPTSLIGPQGPAGTITKQTNSFGPVTVPTGTVATVIEGCTSGSFPTLIGGGYSTSPSALDHLAATVNGPSGSNNWEVDLVNNSGTSVTLTMYTVCTS